MNPLRSNELRKTSMRIIEPSHDDTLSPATKSSKQDFFITQKNIEANLTDIHSHHTQLNNYIADLQNKVNRKVELNEAQIILAYKNHIAIIKKDMEELRKQSLFQANSSNTYLEEIQYLSKKLSVFRDEALRLFQKLEAKDKQIEEIKMKMQENDSEKKHLEQSVKTLTKKNKQLEIQIANFESKPSNEQPEYTHKFDISHLSNPLFRNKYRQNRTTLTSAKISKAHTQNTNIPLPASQHNLWHEKDDTSLSSYASLFTRKLRAKISYLQTQVLKDVVRIGQQTFNEIQRQISRAQTLQRGKSRMERATKISMRSKSNYTVDYGQEIPHRSGNLSGKFPNSQVHKQSRQFKDRQQMSNYFLRCIEVVKKDIVRRKDLKSLNFYKEGNPISFEQFKKVDWYRLLQLILTNEQIVQGLYNLLLQK